MLTHISNNYTSSTVHSSLANSIAKKNGVRQFVYNPLQRKAKINPFVDSDNSIQVVSPKIFNEILRYLPLIKVLVSFVVFILSLRKHNVRPTFIIAHNLWSDGMVAWLYHKFTGVAYTVAVRNTDINLFLPKLRHYRWLMRRVVRDSKRTIFINKAYVERVKNVYSSVFNSISAFKVIYNGIDEQWFDLSESKKESKSKRKLQVIYVGSFLPNKNLKNSLLAISKLNNRGNELKFVAIGGTEAEFLRCTGLSEIPSWVTVIPRTNDRDLIADNLRNSGVFIMPSFHETFGLVYIEALTQGCCIIHSENEGIDGVFSEPFVKSVDPHSIDDIANKIDFLVSQFPCGVSKTDVKRLIADFSWPHIAEQYLEIINEGTI